MHHIQMSYTPLKCEAPYCDIQPFSCTNGFALHFIWTYTSINHYLWRKEFASMPLMFMPLSLLCHTCEVECECVIGLIGGIFNLAQILEYVIQMFTRDSLTHLPHCHWQHFAKSRHVDCEIFAMVMWYVFSSKTMTLMHLYLGHGTLLTPIT